MKSRFARLCVPIFVVATLLFSGCLSGANKQPPVTPPDKTQPPKPVKLTELGRITVAPGSWFTTDDPLSPDGNWVSILAREGDGGWRLWIYPAAGGAGKMLAEISGKASQAGTLLLASIGWTNDSRLVFVRQGTQPDGVHKGARGVSVRIAEPTKDPVDPTEVGWVPEGPGSSVYGIFKAPGATTTYVQVDQTLWSVEGGREPKPVTKSALPYPETLFYPTLSPAGTLFLYRSGAADRAGIHMFDASTGKDSTLVPQGETMGFFPFWSPDGKHLTYYIANKLATPSVQSPYDIVPGEDGPRAVGNSIGLMTPDGKATTSFEVPGSKVSGRQWSDNGKYLGFAGIKVVPPATPEGMVKLEWQSIWVGDLSGKVTKICDVPVAGQTGEIVGVSPSGSEVYIIMDGGNGTSTLWYCKAGQPAEQVKMPDGGRMWLGFSARRIGDNLLIVAEGDAVRPLVQVMGSTVVSTINATGRAFIGNVASGKFVYTLDDREQKTTRVVVMKAE